MSLPKKQLRHEFLPLFPRIITFQLRAPSVSRILPRSTLLSQFLDLGRVNRLSAIESSSSHTPGRGLRRVALFVETSRSEEHTSELQSPDHLVCRLLLEKKNKLNINHNRLFNK